MAKKPASAYAAAPSGKGFAVLRGGKPLQTPGGRDAIVPTQALAEAIAAEWRAQKDKINPASMPLTQLAMTAIDITHPRREAVADAVADFAACDLLCLFAEAPEELVARQKKTWQPTLDWCAQRFDALLATGQGVMPVRQPPEALQALRRAVKGLDAFTLMGVKHAAEVTGSLVLALALAESHMTPRQVFEAAELEALYEIEKWGDDPAAAKRHEAIINDLDLCKNWFRFLQDSVG